MPISSLRSWGSLCFLLLLILLLYQESQAPRLEPASVNTASAATAWEPPQRVVVTHPGATDTLLELGLQSAILGTVAPYGPPPSHLAKAYKRLPFLQAPFVPSREELLLMNADAILAWEHHFQPHALGDASFWQRRGLDTYIVPSSRTERIATLENSAYPLVLELGTQFQRTEAAAAILEDWRLRLEALPVSSSETAWFSVLVIQPYANGHYYLYSPNSLIYDLVKHAGGRPLAVSAQGAVSAETLLALNPDWLVLVATPTGHPLRNRTSDEGLELLRSAPMLQHLKAVQTGRVVTLPFAAVNHGGSRSIEAIEKMALSFSKKGLPLAQHESY